MPYSAGFGNKETDNKTYLSLGLEDKHIYAIDKYEIITQPNNDPVKLGGYTGLLNKIDAYFPRLSKSTYFYF